jgi:hypothetical protein
MKVVVEGAGCEELGLDSAEPERYLFFLIEVIPMCLIGTN